MGNRLGSIVWVTRGLGNKAWCGMRVLMTAALRPSAMDVSLIPRLRERFGTVSDTGGWNNQFFLGDNGLTLAQLNHGSLKETIRRYGGVKLIYIDPPFWSDKNYHLPNMGRSDEKSLAYTDRWAGGLEQYLSMLRERIALMHSLLAEDGSIYVHCDWRATAHIRLMLEEIFGRENYINECIWLYKTGGMPRNHGYGRKHDTIHFVAKDVRRVIWNQQKEKSYLEHRYGFKNIELFEDKRGPYTMTSLRDVWDIPALRGNQPERVDYPTQKPEALLERIIASSSRPGDIVLDCFAGSGTTLAVAQRLGRRWIGLDQGEQAWGVTRKRLLGLGASFDFISELATPQLLRPKFEASNTSDRTTIRLKGVYDASTGLQLRLEEVDIWSIGTLDPRGSAQWLWHSYRTRQKGDLEIEASLPPVLGKIIMMVTDRVGRYGIG